MSLELLAKLRSEGQQPAVVCVTTCYHTAKQWATNAGIWPVVVREGCEYDFSPLDGLRVVLALPKLKGEYAHALARELATRATVVAYDLELDLTSVVIEA